MLVRCQNPTCGAEFQAQRRTARYCNDLCRTQARRARARTERPTNYAAAWRESAARVKELSAELAEIRAQSGLVDQATRMLMSGWDDAQCRQFVRVLVSNGDVDQAAREVQDLQPD